MGSCKGKEGEVGPQGVAGVAGPAGPAGAKGDKGDKGDTGATGATGATGEKGEKGDKGDKGDSAGALQFSVGQVESDGDLRFNLSFDLSSVPNRAALEKGMVLCYYKSADFWFPVPGVVPLNNGRLGTMLFAYRLEDTQMKVVVYSLDMRGKETATDIRVVLVPAQNARLHAGIDYKNYLEVAKAFNLPI